MNIQIAWKFEQEYNREVFYVPCYFLYSNDIPEVQNTTVDAFEDDTALLSQSKDINSATQRLQGNVRN